jgi:hypothetical protein
MSNTFRSNNYWCCDFQSGCCRYQIAQVTDGLFLVLYEDVVVDFQYDAFDHIGCGRQRLVGKGIAV